MFRKSRKLPDSADWVVEGKLAALALPSLEELRQLKAAGFGLVVNLTERPQPTTMAAAVGLKGAHIPLEDMTAPDVEKMEAFVEVVNRYLAQGLPVAVHCLGGRGRTGTMLAAYLVSTGMAPWQAIDEVRRRRRGAIETDEQERAVIRYARYLRQRNAGRSSQGPDDGQRL